MPQNITITVPNWLLSVEFYKEHWFAIYAILSVLYGVVAHALNISRIKKWNGMSEEDRKAVFGEIDWESDIGRPACFFAFVLFSAFGLSYRLSYFVFRFVYNIVLRFPFSFFCCGSYKCMPGFFKLHGGGNGNWGPVKVSGLKGKSPAKRFILLQDFFLFLDSM